VTTYRYLNLQDDTGQIGLIVLYSNVNTDHQSETSDLLTQLITTTAALWVLSEGCRPSDCSSERTRGSLKPILIMRSKS
jgi:hypothetical protein